MDSITWVERIQAINDYLPWFNPTATALGEQTLIKEVIAPNLRGMVAVEFTSKGGKKKRTIDDVIELLNECKETAIVKAKEDGGWVSSGKEQSEAAERS